MRILDTLDSGWSRTTTGVFANGRLHFGGATLLLASLLLAPSVHGEDWPQYLGASRDSVWRETGIIDAFPEGGPKLRWSTKISGGYSGPSVADGRVFVMDRVTKPVENPEDLTEGIPRTENFVRKLLPGSERVLCLREEDGEILWEHEYDCPYTIAALYAIGPRCTPTVDGDVLYTFGAEGHLKCLRVDDGVVVWSKDLKKDYELDVPVWGMSCSPLVDGDRLICIVGGEGTTCVAFDKRTGKEIWRALSAREPGYSSPVIYNIAGKRQLLVWDSDAVHGLSPETGKRYWSVDFPSDNACSIALPRVAGNHVFVTCFANKSGLIEVGKDGNSADVVWDSRARFGVGAVHNTPFIHEGYVFGCGQNGRYTCARLIDGKQQWTTYRPASAKRPIGWGNVFTIRHENRYFLANDKGELIIANLTPEGYDEISRATLIKPTHSVVGRDLVWSHPAFANRSIYLRNDEEMRCYSLARTSQ